MVFTCVYTNMQVNLLKNVFTTYSPALLVSVFTECRLCIKKNKVLWLAKMSNIPFGKT